VQKVREEILGYTSKSGFHVPTLARSHEKEMGSNFCNVPIKQQKNDHDFEYMMARWNNCLAGA
jgi:hypothetical protein